MEIFKVIKRHWKGIVFFVFLIFHLVLVIGKAQTVSQIKTIVLDPGHGGKDPGCNGLFAREKDISLAVALKTKAYIEKYIPDVKVILTRDKDEFVELEERAQIANRNKADLFISIHCNAAGKPMMVRDPKTKKMKLKMRKNARGKWVPVETINPEPFGTETYVMGIKNEVGKMQVAMRENAAIYLEDDYEKKYEGFDPDSEESYIIMSNYTSALVIKSAMMAMKMQEDYKQFAGRVDKGVHRQSIWVLWRTSMPSVLTEIGYLTNPLEEKFLASENGQDYLAKCITRALRRFKSENEGKKYTYIDELEDIKPIENENLLALKNKKSTEISVDKENRDSIASDASSDSNSVENNEDVIERNDRALIHSDSILYVADAKSEFSCDTTSYTIPSYRVLFKSSAVKIDLKSFEGLGLICPVYYIQNQTYKYISGNFNKMKEAADHQKFLQQKGFKDCFIIAWYKGKRITLEEARQLHKYTGN